MTRKRIEPDWIDEQIEEERNKTPKFNAPTLTDSEKIEAIWAVVKRNDSTLREIKHLLRGLALGEKDRIMTVREAAKYCEVSDDTIRRWLKDGKIHKVWLKGKEGLLLSDLNTAIEID